MVADVRGAGLPGTTPAACCRVNAGFLADLYEARANPVPWQAAARAAPQCSCLLRGVNINGLRAQNDVDLPDRRAISYSCARAHLCRIFCGMFQCSGILERWLGMQTCCAMSCKPIRVAHLRQNVLPLPMQEPTQGSTER
jgi:hypothetical protein